MLSLIGIAVVIVGFAARLNPLLVVAAAAIVTGLCGGLDLFHVISAFGHAFNQNRYVSIVWLVLPVVGLLERGGLQERARMLVARIRQATAGRVLLVYLVARQITSALGLTALGGHAPMVRPLIAPMAESAAEAEAAELSQKQRFLVRAFAASADNVGAFFGEDVFIAFGSVLLIRAFLQQSGVDVQPTALSFWAIPTALMALVIHGARLLALDRWLKQHAPAAEEGT